MRYKSIEEMKGGASCEGGFAHDPVRNLFYLAVFACRSFPRHFPRQAGKNKQKQAMASYDGSREGL
jgi:hypothetical protein